MKVLGCDLGGTNVRLRLVECTAGGLPITVAEHQYRSSAYGGLESVLAEFLPAHGLRAADLDHACIAVAGPIQRSGTGLRCQLTNLPWLVDSAALGAVGLRQLTLVNDFEAIGYGLGEMQDTDLLTLQEGEPVMGAPKALIGAGTGLGQALLVWNQDGYQVIATEGGHADFAPTDDLQLELMQYLRTQLGRVSYEDVVSGPGLERIYGFLESYTHQSGMPLTPPADDPELAAAIGRAASRGDHPLAAAAVDLFLTIYGAQAGNLALTSMARAGVYIAGGIAPKLANLIQSGAFLRSFRAKGRMAHLMPLFPLHLVRNADVGLAGATALACRHALRPQTAAAPAPPPV